ncbi:MAG: IS110 family transposase, partial [Actinobacteria bacterium]|nr:IS110 family transposase [Actinomycetota bacterium]
MTATVRCLVEASATSPPAAFSEDETGNRGARQERQSLTTRHRPRFIEGSSQQRQREEGELFVGVDWASDDHAVCVVEDAGRKQASFGISHSKAGFDELVSRLRRFGDPSSIPVAIERPDGRLVDRLLEAGHPVIWVEPKAIKKWRESEIVSGAKSDAGDAYVIAEILRLCFHRLKPIDPFSDATRALRAAVR